LLKFKTMPCISASKTVFTSLIDAITF